MFEPETDPDLGCEPECWCEPAVASVVVLAAALVAVCGPATVYMIVATPAVVKVAYVLRALLETGSRRLQIDVEAIDGDSILSNLVSCPHGAQLAIQNLEEAKDYDTVCEIAEKEGMSVPVKNVQPTKVHAYDGDRFGKACDNDEEI